MLGGGLLHHVGWPELSQFTEDGRIRVGRFHQAVHPAVTGWANAEGVPLANLPTTA